MTRDAMPARVLQRRRRLLRRGVYLLDRHFLRHTRRYLVQAALAATTLAAVLAVRDALTNAAIVTAIASSAFIIFLTPHSRMSSPRRVLGGHAVGIVVGLGASLVVHDLANEPYSASLVTDISAAIAVGVGMLVMAATDTEHPPAAGTVLGLILAPQPVENGMVVILAAVALSATRSLCRRWLIDLAH